jgi:dynein heavy chain
VDGERLARVDTKEWRDLVFTICFLHSAVQERRKFGPVGWCIPYEFNNGDLEASLTFLEKHCFSSGSGISWPTILYMICEVQYGGRITDDFDRLLFNTFGNVWLDPSIMRDDFLFFPTSGNFQYKIPNVDSIEGYKKFISEFPGHDSPDIFGLHSNADLTFGTTEAKYILNTILETQPKGATAAGGKTPEEEVVEKCEELLAMMTELGYDDEVVRSQIRKRHKAEMAMVTGETSDVHIDGFTIPGNIFLYQEVSRLNSTIKRVRDTLQDLCSAVRGEIIMTPELQEALTMIHQGRPPRHWFIDPSGAAIAWSLPSLVLWFNSMLEREDQLSAWLTIHRPKSYWMTGFFNPQGFLTAMRQEVTRRHKSDKWALDDVSDVTEVTDIFNHAHITSKKVKEEGVYVHGLFLEGSSWNFPQGDKKERMLVESTPKELFCPMPVLYVTGASSKVIRQREAEANKNMGDRRIYYYDCPVYTIPRRTDLNYVFNIKLKTDVSPQHWTLRGVSALLSIN